MNLCCENIVFNKVLLAALQNPRLKFAFIYIHWPELKHKCHVENWG